MFWAGYNGYITDVLIKDHTYLTSFMTLIYLYATANLYYMGHRIYSAGRFTKNLPEYFKTTLQKYSNRAWFLSELQMALAIIGTSIGIIILLGVKEGINVTDTTSLQPFLTSLWTNLGVAFYPNAVGLIYAAVLKVQAYFMTEDYTQ
jgi:hypothetical protein